MQPMKVRLLLMHFRQFVFYKSEVGSSLFCHCLLKRADLLHIAVLKYQ
uniref:Uncharacterized protein n=1 Tax=Arundo donax TaxID=35708 RepID=A0A0A8ZEF0_ARUDO